MNSGTGTLFGLQYGDAANERDHQRARAQLLSQVDIAADEALLESSQAEAARAVLAAMMSEIGAVDAGRGEALKGLSLPQRRHLRLEAFVDTTNGQLQRNGQARLSEKSTQRLKRATSELSGLRFPARHDLAR